MYPLNFSAYFCWVFIEFHFMWKFLEKSQLGMCIILFLWWFEKKVLILMVVFFPFVNGSRSISCSFLTFFVPWKKYGLMDILGIFLMCVVIFFYFFLAWDDCLVDVKNGYLILCLVYLCKEKKILPCNLNYGGI